MDNCKFIDNSSGIADVAGFRLSGVACDIRGDGKPRLDLALIVADRPCAAAGVFTRNRIAAAPVVLGREQLQHEGIFRAIVVNSGNANACTGERGRKDAEAMRRQVAIALGCEEAAVFVCSTGRIGRHLPMDKVQRGISAALAELSTQADASLRAADAILTSDTRRKVCSIEVTTAEGVFRLAGMAKGAGMIEPNMATMLAFIGTDAQVADADLRTALQGAVADTFNAVTVDGDQSTNDTVLLLANGASGIRLSAGASPGWLAFCAALHQLCFRLAQMIVGDGEKISKVVEIRVEGAATAEDAQKTARAIGNSLLVKSSWYGNDPNWGRLLDAVGYSGASVSEQSVTVGYAHADGSGAVTAFARGEVFTSNHAAMKEIVAQPRFQVLVDLGMGAECARLWATDLTEGYVAFNKSE